jgi:hypothetical protein
MCFEGIADLFAAAALTWFDRSATIGNASSKSETVIEVSLYIIECQPHIALRLHRSIPFAVERWRGCL